MDKSHVVLTSYWADYIEKFRIDGQNSISYILVSIASMTVRICSFPMKSLARTE